MNAPREILDFWFGSDPERPLEMESRWWKKDPDFDEEIRKRFGGEQEAALRGERDHWKQTPEGSLAWIILLDQFSRNIFRNSPRAFAQDAQALQAALAVIDRGDDEKLTPVQRWFLYMPLMHSEEEKIQRRSLELYSKLAQSGPEALKKKLASAHDFAKRHAEIVFRFRRFPHRNSLLGRTSTPEEERFLLEPGSSF